MAPATFGAGCLVGVEVAFRRVPACRLCRRCGAGPSHEQVCTGRTEHAEVVQVEYDPAKVGYQLLDVFWANQVRLGSIVKDRTSVRSTLGDPAGIGADRDRDR